MIKDLIKVNDRVLYLLVNYPVTRDSDKELWLAYNVSFNNLKNKIKLGDYRAFRSWIISSNTPVFESLSRCRRKIQEERLDLRGIKYLERKAEAQGVREMMR